MKISYHKQGQDKSAIFDAQVQMKEAKAKKFPAMMVFVGAISSILIVWGLIVMVRERSIYCYGMVQSIAEEVRLPFTGVVRDLNAVKGRHVSKGDLLFYLESSDGGMALSDLHERLNRKKQRLLKLIAARDGDFESDELIAAGKELSNAEAELLRMDKQHSLEMERVKSDIGRAELEVAALGKVLKHKTKRHEDIKTLVELGAAVKDNQSSAEVELEIASKNLAVAKLDQSLAEQAEAKVKVINEKVLEKKKVLVQGLRNEFAKKREAAEKNSANAAIFADDEIRMLNNEIKSLEAIVASSTGGKIYLRSQFDGIITEVSITEGSQAIAGIPVVKIASTHDMWVNAYIPVNKKQHFDNSSEALVLTAADGHYKASIDKTIGLFEVETPLLLQRRMPNDDSVLYSRLLLDGDAKVFPGAIVKVIIKPE